jgi:hypothetical protein
LPLIEHGRCFSVACLKTRGLTMNEEIPDPLRSVSERAQAEGQEMDLRQLRQARQWTGEAIAEAMDVSLGGVAKMEARMDMSISSMREFVEAMGGTLEVVARFPDHSVRITGFSGLGNLES